MADCPYSYDDNEGNTEGNHCILYRGGSGLISKQRENFMHTQVQIICYFADFLVGRAPESMSFYHNSVTEYTQK